jgi:peroxiredoxin
MKISSMKYISVCFVVIALLISGFTAFTAPSGLKNGKWRAAIHRPDGHNIIFNFETRDSVGRKIIYIINGAEKLLVDSIIIQGDSVFIELPFFESAFRAQLQPNGNLQGVWIKKFGPVIQSLPFSAKYNVPERFPVIKPPIGNISGRWSSKFIEADGKSSEITAEFKQAGAYLTGTFLDPTGDYRFLEGVVSGDSLKLSAFDGGHAYMFTAKVDDKNRISGGHFFSGAKGKETWSALRNEHAPVPDGYGQTKLKSGADKLNFRFPDATSGEMVSINDPKYQGKVVLIQILGSWCPNCMDETKFLSDYYQKNHQRGMEIVGLAYERTTDFYQSQKALQPFIKRFNIQYPVLITGVTVSDSLRTQKTLPQLDAISAFPTTIFIDKKGNVRRIYSGFNGPATGKHYTDFIKEFTESMDKLLEE